MIMAARRGPLLTGRYLSRFLRVALVLWRGLTYNSGKIVTQLKDAANASTYTRYYCATYHTKCYVRNTYAYLPTRLFQEASNGNDIWNCAPLMSHGCTWSTFAFTLYQMYFWKVSESVCILLPVLVMPKTCQNTTVTFGIWRLKGKYRKGLDV